MGYVAHIRAAGRMNAFLNVCCAENLVGVFAQQRTEVFIGLKREVARKIRNIALSVQRHGARIKCAVNVAVVAGERLDVGRTRVALHLHVVRNDIHKVAAGIDDRMEAHAVVFAEGLAQRIDAHHPHHCRIECIDAAIRSTSRMSGTAVIFDQFADKAVRTCPNGEFPLGIGGRVDVHHHSHIDVVKGAFSNELLFAP